MLRIDIDVLYTVINLLVLYFLMKKFLFGRIDRVLKEREKLIRKNFDDADAAKADAEKEKAASEAQRAGIEEERTRVLEEYRRKAAAEYDRIVGDAGRQATSIVEQARTRAARDAEDQKKDTMDHMADLVVDATWKLAAKEGTPDSRLYDTFTEQLQKEAESASAG